MADRSVIIRLQVDAKNFQDGMLKSGTSVRVLSSELQQNQQQTKKSTDGLEKFSRSATIAGGALLAGFGLGVRMFANFDQQMSNVAAAAGATAGEMDQLRRSAIEAGRSTFYSATEAAQGQEELAKAGLTTADIVGGALAGALNLAASGGIEVAEAAETAASAMTVFKLSGKDVPHIADVLAAAAGKAQGGVQDMSQAFKQSALVAAQTGLSLEDTAGVLAEFASAGLKGSDAGTSLRTMLLRLNPQSKEAAALMDQLNLSAFDQQGKFIGLAAYADKLQAALGGMSVEQRNAALQTLFGQDAIRAATILYSDGATGVRKWVDAVDDQGYAADQASKRMDNLNGDIEQFKGAIESAILAQGANANDVLRTMVQRLTNVVNGFAALPGPVQQVGVYALGASGGLLAMVGASGMAYVQLTKLQESLSQGSAAAQFFGKGVGTLKGGLMAALPVIGLATIALDQYGQMQQRAKQRVADFTAAIQADNGALGDNVRATTAKMLAEERAFDAAKRAGISQRELTEATVSGGKALESLLTQMQKHGDLSNDEAIAIVRTHGAMKQGEKAANDLAAATSSAAKGADKNELAQSSLAQALGTTTDTMDDQARYADTLKKALDELSGKALNTAEAQNSFEDALAKVVDTAKENGAALESTEPAWTENSKKARENRDAFLGLIEAGNKVVESMADQGASSEELQAKLAGNRQSFYDVGAAAGLNRDEVDKLIARYAEIPAQVTTNIVVTTDEAVRKVQNAIYEMEKNVYIDVQGVIHAGGYATGGRVIGPGSGTSDSIPALLSNDEYVITAEAARRIGYSTLDRMNYGMSSPVPMYSPPFAAPSSTGGPDLAAEIRALRNDLAQLTNAHAQAVSGAIERQGRDIAMTSRMGSRR